MIDDKDCDEDEGDLDHPLPIFIHLPNASFFGRMAWRFRMPSKLPRAIAANFELEGPLGHGAVAQVLRIRQRKTPRIQLALKIVEKQPLKIRGMLPQVG